MNDIIVRADDLGYSRGVNLGIADSVHHGIIQSVGVMTNMPETISGLKMIGNADVCLGLHTNICVGKPLCDPKEIPSLVQENGEFKSSRTYRSAKEDFVVLDEVIKEIEAQYQRFVELTGGKPGYFEGHAVQSENFFKGMEIVAKRHGCDFLPFGLGKPVPFKDKMLMLELDAMKPDYDPFECLKEYVRKDYGEDVIPVMVCHPGYLDAFILNTSSLTTPRVLEVEMATSSKTKEWLKQNGVDILRFDTL